MYVFIDISPFCLHTFAFIIYFVISKQKIVNLLFVKQNDGNSWISIIWIINEQKYKAFS